MCIGKLKDLGFASKEIVFLILALALAYGLVQEHGSFIPSLSPWTQNTDNTLLSAYKNRQSDLQVQGQGVVTKILPDDLEGSRHQRFILKLSTGQTLLIAHNIELASRVTGLRTGDTVEFYGEYEWNAKGGVIHWTHHDPKKHHLDGWLKHNGIIYQ
jgi:hypothetical protein